MKEETLQARPHGAKSRLTLGSRGGRNASGKGAACVQGCGIVKSACIIRERSEVHFVMKMQTYIYKGTCTHGIKGFFFLQISVLKVFSPGDKL